MLGKILDYIAANKEWIFSGVGVAIILSAASLLKGVFRRRKEVPVAARESLSRPESKSIPSHWQGILPEGTKFEIVSEPRDYIQLVRRRSRLSMGRADMQSHYAFRTARLASSVSCSHAR
jgi:hypothetical protein